MADAARRLQVSVFLAFAAMPAAAGAGQRTFVPSTEVFPNPERGFYRTTELVNDPDFDTARSVGDTLVHSYVRLDAYRNSALPASLLNAMGSGFQKARVAGVKIVLRFAYNFGPYPDSEPDASRARIQAHLTQLAPVLAANADVIFVMQAGFIGAWGEWHTSTNGLDNPTDKGAILGSILDALPASRQTQLRYPPDIRRLNGPPITAAEAWSGSDRSRVGFHNDCFLASTDDWGTWGREDTPIEQEKDFIAANGLYTVVGGETCNVNPPRSACATALAELARMHWTYLNEEYHEGVVAAWKSGGCFDEMKRRLGYRIALTRVEYPTSAAPGGPFTMAVDLVNQGWAAMMNARPVYAVLDGPVRVRLLAAADPRRWPSGAASAVRETLTLPADLPPGTYRLALWLPDAAEGLRGNHAYAVRFANAGVWEAANGWNVVANDVVIDSSPMTPTPTPTATPTSSPTPTPTSTPLPPTATPTPATPTNTPTPSPTPDPTSTPSPTPTATATPTGSCSTATSGGPWQSASFTRQQGTFTAELDLTPLAAPINAVAGLAPAAPTGHTGLAAIVRFNPAGIIDARNGGVYATLTSVAYAAGTTYRVRFVVDVPARRYSVHVRAPGGAEQTIARDFAFRSEQSAATSLAAWGLYTGPTPAGSLRLCNFSVSGAAGYLNVTPSAAGVTASSHDGNGPANTVDNSLSTRWSALGDGQWARYDLGAVRKVAYVTLAVYNGASRRNRFELQVSSDGQAWTTVWSGESIAGSAQQQTYDFADTDARFVRYLGHGSSVSAWNSVTELDVWAVAPN